MKAIEALKVQFVGKCEDGVTREYVSYESHVTFTSIRTNVNVRNNEMMYEMFQRKNKKRRCWLVKFME
jgi:hypothetical protein